MKRSSRWWTVAAIVLLGAAVWPLWAVELPPPEQGGPRPGVDIVVGQAGSQPQSVGEVLAMGTGIIETGGPHITFEATEPGYVYGQQAVFIITGSTDPWQITVTGWALKDGSGHSIPPSRIEMRDAAKEPEEPGEPPGTKWVSIDGGPLLQNPAGADPERMWMQIEFRIKVEAGDAAGHYQSDVVLEWVLASGGGSIPMELHLNVAGSYVQITAPENIIYFHVGVGVGEHPLSETLAFNLQTNSGNYVGLEIPSGGSVAKLTGDFDCRGNDIPDREIPVSWQLRWNAGSGWSGWQDGIDGTLPNGCHALYWLLAGGDPGNIDFELKCSADIPNLQSNGHYALATHVVLVPYL